MEADGDVELQGNQMKFKTYSNTKDGLYDCTNTAAPGKLYYFYIKAKGEFPIFLD